MRRGNHDIVIRNEQTEVQGTPSSGNAGRKPYIRGKLGENLTKYNFKSIAVVGLIIRQARMGNELIGAYSGDRLRQQRVQTGMQYALWGIGVAKFGIFGLAYVAGDAGYRIAMDQINIMKQNREARHKRDISGTAVNSESRHSGGML